METSKTITLVSSDGEKFQVSEKAARRSQLIKGIIDDYPDDPEVPLHNVKSNILQRIISYLEYYKDTEPREIEKPLPSINFNDCVDAWDFQFIELDIEVIFEIIFAANYMDIKPLLELASSKIASHIKGKSPEEIRKIFNIQNDFTPEEEAQIREENQWCMENL
jgi:S-phase kinase-associated protein 1